MTAVRRRHLVSAVALLVLLSFAPPAWSREFSIVGCEAASGSTTEGWYDDRTHGGVVARIMCPTGNDPLGGLLTRSAISPPGTSNQTVPPGSAARMIFNAPPGTVIVGLRASYYFSRDHGSWQAGLSNGARILRGCSYRGFPCIQEGVNEFIPVPFNRAIYIETMCAGGDPCPIDRGSHDPTGLQARAQLTATEVRLVDDSAPRLELKGGSALVERWASGDLEAVVEASDNAGVPLVQILVDGRHETERGVPCRVETYQCPNFSNRLTLPSVGRIADGRHQLTVRAFDRAGNPVEASRELLVDNTPPTQPLDVRVEDGSGWRGQSGRGARRAARRYYSAGLSSASSGLEMPEASSPGCSGRRSVSLRRKRLANLAKPTPNTPTGPVNSFAASAAFDQSDDSREPPMFRGSKVFLGRGGLGAGSSGAMVFSLLGQ